MAESAERRIEAALSAIRRGLDAMGVPWMIIGGIAVIARGVRRMTTDIDAVVLGDAAPVARARAARKSKPARSARPAKKGSKKKRLS